ncbi:MAG TPA: peptidogalycan biosysnthesis protein [Rhodocyclaceae bacterium]|nr:peptidogalycan biosysnthesis protein [Rhodocyclaceae bacterium]
MPDHAKPLAELVGLAGCDELPLADWRRLADRGHPFANPNFLSTLEKHETAGPRNGWQALHWLARDEDGGALGLIPGYIKSHSHGDFLRDWSWAGAYQQLGKDYYPKLFSGWPHTPASGRRILLAPGAAPDTATQMIRSVQKWVKEQTFSSWHFALPLAAEVELLRRILFAKQLLETTLTYGRYAAKALKNEG